MKPMQWKKEKEEEYEFDEFYNEEEVRSVNRRRLPIGWLKT